jgi:hypothetical protein
MKTLMKLSALLLAALLVCTNLRAQTVDDIVNKYVAAIGGKTAVDAVKTLYVESDVDYAGNNLPSTTWIINGKGYKNEFDFQGTKIQNCVTDKGGWMINPMLGSSTPTPMPDEQAKSMKGQMNVGGPLYDYAAKGNKVELTGQDSADYLLKVSNGSVNSTIYVNKKTYYMDKLVSRTSIQGQDVEITVSFADYRKLDGGFVFGFSQTIVQPMATVNITHKKVEVNKTIDPAIFEMPK